MLEVTVQESNAALRQLLLQVQGQLLELQAINIILSTRLTAAEAREEGLNAEVTRLTAEPSVAKPNSNGASEPALPEPIPIR